MFGFRLQTPDEQVFELDHAITNPNNGLIFCFRMPDELQKSRFWIDHTFVRFFTI